VSSVKGFLGWDNLEVESAGDTVATPTDQVDAEERKSLFKQLYNFVGKDITSMISLPVWVFEPLSFLQIMTEPMLYGDLIFKVTLTCLSFFCFFFSLSSFLFSMLFSSFLFSVLPDLLLFLTQRLLTAMTLLCDWRT
jgi:hypothetical protein